jgi:hypothetical protein
MLIRRWALIRAERAQGQRAERFDKEIDAEEAEITL